MHRTLCILVLCQRDLLASCVVCRETDKLGRPPQRTCLDSAAPGLMVSLPTVAAGLPRISSSTAAALAPRAKLERYFSVYFIFNENIAALAKCCQLLSLTAFSCSRVVLFLPSLMPVVDSVGGEAG